MLHVGSPKAFKTWVLIVYSDDGVTILIPIAEKAALALIDYGIPLEG